MKELFQLFFGDATLAQVVFNFIVINVGIAISVVAHVAKGIKVDKKSPDEFHLGYFFRDNFIRILSVGLTMFVTWIYMEEIVHYFAEWIPNPMARLTPLILGLLNDRIYVWITKLKK